MTGCFICCDWGTTSFRMKVSDSASGQVLCEESSRNGAAVMYNQWKSAQEVTPVSQQDYYLSWLNNKVEQSAKQSGIDLSAATIIISGMAGSSIGMLELPYAAAPFELNGRNAMVKRIVSNKIKQEVYLISGISNGNDVMRGEETQLAGLAAMQRELFIKDAVCILPGTHSKHVYTKKGSLMSFKTYMTGEVFSVLNEHSILKPGSPVLVDRSALSTHDWVSFTSGVQQSQHENLLNSLFTVRTRRLLKGEDDRSNFFFLSGLLIGNELAELVAVDTAIILCSTGNVYEFYRQALAVLGLSPQTTFVSPEQMERAYWEGQLKIIDHFIQSQ